MSKKLLRLLIVPVLVLMLFMSAIFIISFKYPMEHRAIIEKYAIEYNVSPALVSSIILAESGFDSHAKSTAGALGLMQLMPETAKFICKKINLTYSSEQDLFDPKTNIQIGTYYLSYLSNKYPDTYTLLCSYNAGEGTIKKWLANKDYSLDQTSLLSAKYQETALYAQKVISFYNVYKRKYNSIIF